MPPLKPKRRRPQRQPKQHRHAGEPFEKELELFLADGWSDEQIAGGYLDEYGRRVSYLPGLPWTAASVGYWRRKLGFKKGEKEDNVLAKRTIRNRINGGHWWLRYADDGTISDQEIKILEALAEHRRPMTRQQLAVVLKIPWGPRVLQTGAANALGRLLRRQVTIPDAHGNMVTHVGLVERVPAVGPKSNKRGRPAGAYKLRKGVQRQEFIGNNSSPLD